MGFIKFICYIVLIMICTPIKQIDLNYQFLGLCILAAGAIAYSRRDDK